MSEITELRDRLQEEWESEGTPGLRRVNFDIFLLFKVRDLEAKLEVTERRALDMEYAADNNNEACKRVEAKLEAIERAYSLLWAFDISPMFDAKARYISHKAREWKVLLDRANAIAPRPLAAPDAQEETK